MNHHGANNYRACFQFQKSVFGDSNKSSGNFIFFGLPFEQCREFISVMAEFNSVIFVELDLVSLDQAESLVRFNEFLSGLSHSSGLVLVRVDQENDGFVVERMVQRANATRAKVKIILILESGNFYLRSKNSFLLDRFETIDLSNPAPSKERSFDSGDGYNRMRLIFDYCNSLQKRCLK